MFPVHVENIGWVTGLRGTGSDPEPSPQRSVLVEEMQRRGVANPNTLLASHNASMVLVARRYRPGIQKGDHFSTSRFAFPAEVKPPACAAAICWKPGSTRWPS